MVGRIRVRVEKKGLNMSLIEITDRSSNHLVSYSTSVVGYKDIMERD